MNGMTRVLAAVVMLVSSTAWAQQPVSQTGPMRTDHDEVINRIGVTYFGQFAVPLGNDASDSVGVQMIGARYWMSDMLGIDAALGLSIGSGSDKSGGVSVDAIVPTAFGLMVGLPLNLHSGKHYTFFVAPMVQLGIASATAPGVGNAPDVDFSGFRFTFGARAGAEVQFGFIGIPNLALDATVSLLGDVRNGSREPSGGSEDSFSRFSLTTDVNGQPWDIFVTNVVVRYYF
jgi:hypothetical protein